MQTGSNLVKIADSINELRFGKNNIAVVFALHNKICIAKSGSGLTAFSASCPHASGDLSQGVLDKKGNIICPVHGYRFSTSSGRDSNDEGYFLKVYALEQTAEGIFLRL